MPRKSKKTNTKTAPPAETEQDQDQEQPESATNDDAVVEAAKPAKAAKDTKRKRKAAGGDDAKPEAGEGEPKKAKVKEDKDGDEAAAPAGEEGKDEPPLVLASKEGTTIFRDNDVLSGRGGGTNVHPGNRNFRDLINLHRRAYLKARKNDKPAISRMIVRSVRESNGRFLKKEDKSGLWFEIGDDAAREKTSQALRQRAPEMRKLLFDTEREEARAVAEDHLRQQRMLMGVPPEMMAAMPPGMGPPMMGPGGMPMFPNPAAMMAMAQKNGIDPNSAWQMYPGFFPQGPPPPGGANNGPPNNSGAPAPGPADEAPAPASNEEGNKNNSDTEEAKTAAL